MAKEIIVSDSAPAAIGPYSQAVKVGNMLFLSGQIPLDPGTGQIVGESAAEQARQVLLNIGSVLSAVGAGYDDVVKTTVFMVDLLEFQSVNEVYAEFFSDLPPARSTVQVAALPRGARVEIEVTAFLG